jgi:hypothetical protein
MNSLPRRYLGFLRGFKCEFCADSVDYYSRRARELNSWSKVQILLMILINSNSYFIFCGSNLPRNPTWEDHGKAPE